MVIVFLSSAANKLNYMNAITNHKTRKDIFNKNDFDHNFVKIGAATKRVSKKKSPDILQCQFKKKEGKNCLKYFTFNS